MASTGSISNFRMRLMPAEAILKHELASLWASWLVRLWIVATILVTLLILASNWAKMPTAPLIQSMLFPYLVFPWFLIVIVLGISPVTGSRLDTLSDGILSRPITRHEYLLAAWAARVIVVLAVCLAVIVPAALLAVFAKRNVAADPVTLYGVVATLTVVGLVQVSLVTLGFLVGTLLRRPMLAAVVLVFTWLPINLVLSTFSLEEFSPFTLQQAIPTLLRTTWATPKEDDAESPVSEDDVEALAAQADQFMRLLSGKSPPPARRERGGLFENMVFDDLSVPRVLLGYGVPTLLALGLALLVFDRRDL
ncbi:MAG: ABC transporter permease subunit [Planctomycetes bacterium]|nr:ABC transporter permease subunit [Planctomycetota bacterium]